MEKSDLSKDFCDKFRKKSLNCIKIFPFTCNMGVCAMLWHKGRVYLHCKNTLL